jgi:hypothetical protein
VLLELQIDFLCEDGKLYPWLKAVKDTGACVKDVKDTWGN